MATPVDNASFDPSTFIGEIGKAQGGVDQAIKDVKNADTAQERLEASMDLMVAQQKLSILSESFSKYMKATTDAQKSAIQSMN